MTFLPFETEAFESPRSLVQRGRDQIDELAITIKAFFENRPYTRVVDFDPDSGQDVHKIRLTADIPRPVKNIVKDVTSNLRDALDHAVYSSAVCIVGGTPANTGFPFAKDAAGVRGELDGKRLRGNPPEIRPFLAGLNPHETGNPLLWGLNRIRNPNTHRVLIPVGAASQAHQLAIGKAYGMGRMQAGYSRWDAAKNEVEFLRVGGGSILDYQVNFTFFITFGDVDVLRGQEVTGTLRAIAAEVDRVVNAIEAETLRILGHP